MRTRRSGPRARALRVRPRVCPTGAPDALAVVIDHHFAMSAQILRAEETTAAALAFTVADTSLSTILLDGARAGGWWMRADLADHDTVPWNPILDQAWAVYPFGKPEDVVPTASFQDVAGQFGDPGAVAGLTAGFDRCRPGRGRDLQHGVVDGLGDGHPDRVGQPPAACGEPVQELVGAAGGVGADQGAPTSPVLSGQLGQSQFGDGDVVGCGVAAGLARSQ